MTMTDAFKAYDIRGRLPNELNADIAYQIGRAFAEYLKPQKVVVGYDIRLSSPELASALMNALNDAGCHVIDLGLVGTEEVYFATEHLNADGGIMVTASHNPKDYNGMKLVREQAKPISGDSGLNEIRALVQDVYFEPLAATERTGLREQYTIGPEYTRHILSFVDAAHLRPLKIVVNAGNGAAGHMLDALEAALPFEFIKINHQPDGHFPNGIPNPLLVENRAQTRDAVLAHGADFGVAWDGDVDRCFLFDEQGLFIEGYYLVGLLAKAFLLKNAGAKIIHDPRLTWNTIDTVTEHGGIPVQSKTGHAFIKEKMRAEDAVYGGEMSAHHYFRDFSYCDSGMLPWLLIAELVCREGALSQMVAQQQAKYPVSGEINRRVDNPQAVISRIYDQYASSAVTIEHVDGISMSFDNWRFNLRSSNTEPVLRLNVESKNDVQLMQQQTDAILALMDAQ